MAGTYKMAGYFSKRFFTTSNMLLTRHPFANKHQPGRKFPFSMDYVQPILYLEFRTFSVCICTNVTNANSWSK